MGLSVSSAAAAGYVQAAAVNYLPCISILFRHRARGNSLGEVIVYLNVVPAGGCLDVGITTLLARCYLAFPKAAGRVLVL